MKNMKFEEALEKLKEIVEQLDAGDLDLDASLKGFEKGVRLLDVCTKRLDEVEKRVELLVKDREGGLSLTPFEEEDDGPEEEEEDA